MLAIFQLAMIDDTFAERWREIRATAVGTIVDGVMKAQKLGFDLCCSSCGQSEDLYDDESNYHEMFCPNNPELEQNRETAARWAEKQKDG
jgi:hypothetical protein